MSDELKSKIEDFIKYIIGKVDKKEIEDIQNKYNELMEYFDKFAILTVEDFESLDKEISDYDSLKEEMSPNSMKSLLDL